MSSVHQECVRQHLPLNIIHDRPELSLWWPLLTADDSEVSSLRAVSFFFYRLCVLKIEEHTLISCELSLPLTPSYPASCSLQGSCGLAASSWPTTSSTNWAASRSPWCDRVIGWVTLLHRLAHFLLSGLCPVSTAAASLVRLASVVRHLFIVHMLFVFTSVVSPFLCLRRRLNKCELLCWNL